MELTHHASLRSSQRAINLIEMDILNGIGLTVEQKGNTSIITIVKGEKPKWVNTLKEVLVIMAKLTPSRNATREFKGKVKAVRRLLSHLESGALPYFVYNPESNKVITCGHLSNRIRRNY